jgi:hypothetical protein
MYSNLAAQPNKALTYQETAVRLRLTISQIKCLVLCGKLARRGSQAEPILLEDLNDFMLRLHRGQMHYGTRRELPSSL